MRARLALLLALLAATPAAAAALPADHHLAAAPPVLFLRSDPDGNRTFILWLEDDPAGTYTHTRTAAPTSGEVREIGTYVHRWTHQGTPETTIGVYLRTVSQGLVRFPRVIVENAPDDVAFANAVSQAVLTDMAGSGSGLGPFVLEVAAPEVGDFSASSFGFGNFVQRPTVVAWHARRVLAGTDAWLGTYLARDAAVQAVPGGQQGWRSAEVGVVARDGLAGTDTRVAGAFVEQRVFFQQGLEDRAAASEFTVGARSPAGRTPLATLRGDDLRGGGDLRDPVEQRSALTLGVHGPDGFVPLAALRTDVRQRFHDQGVEVERTTAAGVFLQGAWTPVAGMRYHSDRAAPADLPFQLVDGGVLGGPTGDAELSVGAYVQGAYQPMLQVTLDDTFAGATLPHRTMVSVGAFTPLRYQPLASVTYEGTDSLVDWALRVVDNDERGSAWMVSTGPWVGQLYAPVLGVRFRGDAPGMTQAHEAEVAVGTFVAGYTAFVPLAAARASSDEAFPAMALRTATEGLGNQGGTWNAGAGAYAPGQGFVPLVDVRYRPVQDPEAARSGDVDVLLAGQPAVGVQYRGQKSFVPSFNTPTNPNDDSPWRIAVGAHTPVGFVPLVRVYHDGTGNTVLLGPDVAV